MGYSMPQAFGRSGSKNLSLKVQTPADIWRRKDDLARLGIRLTKVVWRSLETADKREARAKQAEIIAELEQQWTKLREALHNGPLSLSDVEVWAIASDTTRALLKAHEKDHGNWRDWTAEAGQQRWVRLLGAKDKMIAKALTARIEDVLKSKGLIVDDSSRIKVLYRMIGYDTETAKRLAKNPKADIKWPDEGDINRTFEVLARRASQGDYGEPEFLKGRPTVEKALGERHKAQLTFDDLVTNWEKHGRGNIRPAASSVSKYRQVASRLRTFLKHDDPARVTSQDAQRFLEHVSAASPDGTLPADKQVWDVMTNVSTLYRRAVKAEKLTSNPFQNVIPPKSGKGEKAGRRAFTDKEARTLLLAARMERDTFRRWAPWLMAYSGMRVTEAGQLRKQDIEQDGRQWFIHLRHEAGHVKSGVNRLVPVHRALHAEGFLKFVASVKGPWLFPHVCLDAEGNRFNSKGRPNDSKAHKLSEWVWKQGLDRTDKRLAPDHSWRHRFRTVAAKKGLSQLAVDRIVGHTDSSVKADYERDELRELLLKTIRLFPDVPDI